MLILLTGLTMQAAAAPSIPAQRAHPAQPLGSYIAATDYPATAIATRSQGTAAFRLLINRDGGVETCRITVSSGSAALDETTCWLMRERARFVGARNQAGEPVADLLESRIRWVLPAPAAGYEYPTGPNDPAVRTTPAAPLASYLRAADYPNLALINSQQANVFFEIDVDSSGRPAACRIMRSGGVPALNAATCRALMRRARFNPARDAQGNPVPDRIASFVQWRIG